MDCLEGGKMYVKSWIIDLCGIIVADISIICLDKISIFLIDISEQEVPVIVL